MSEPASNAIVGTLSDLYDVFVDWPGRLGRELPGLRTHLADASRVLDLGCGTGRHVDALLDEGFDAHGADLSADMLEKARAFGVPAERLHTWRLGDAAPGSLAGVAPFDAAVSLGNVWPQVVEPAELERVAAELQRLVRPGGALVVGLKAFGVRRESGNPYLPLLKRRHQGRALWFVRWVDFDVEQPAEGPLVCDLHVAVLAGEATQEREALTHRASRVRAWQPEELGAWFRNAGFESVAVSGRLDDPTAVVTSEDVFVSARRAD